MKKCPFCAEEIQDEAIKCRFCGSFLSSASPDHKAEVLTPVPRHPRGGAAILAPGIATAPSTPVAPNKRVLYSGSPSWRAFFQLYFLIVLGASTLPVLFYWIASRFEASSYHRTLSAAVPLVVALLCFAVLHHYRRSKVVRVTASNIEVEHGFFSKGIDVLELWRCRDVRYRQSLLDRILLIAHIDIYTTDVTTPNVCIVGLPAARELFENIRDSIEIQKQSKNVVGMIQ